MSTNVSRRKRRPISKGIVTGEIPTRQRSGEWTAFAEQWKASPGERFLYEMAAPSQAAYLKGRYGVETMTRNTHFVDDDDNFVANEDAYQTDADGKYVLGENGKRVKREDVSVVCDLHVIYDPNTADANIAAARKAKEAAKVKAAAKKAAGKK